jgi:hypothetical protein
MNLPNPLPTTWEAVQVAKDAFTLARRLLAQFPSHRQTRTQQIFLELCKQTVYEAGKPLSSLQPHDRTAKLNELEKEIDGLLVLELWATFERFLRDYLQEVLKPQSQPVPFADSLRYQRLCDDLQRWRMGDILDFLKDSSADPRMPRLIKDAKNILMYRNWVAPADPKKRQGYAQILNPLITL